MLRDRSNWTVIALLPSALLDVICVTPRICPNCRSSGWVTEDALISGRHSAVDDGNAVADLADFERARFDRAVGLDHIRVVAVRPALQRARRHGHRIRRRAREKADIEELSRPQGAIFIGESAFET